MGLILIDPAVTLPVELAELKLHCGVEDNSFDTLLTTQLKAAIAHVEQVLDRALGTQTWQLALDEFADVIELPRGPVLEIVTDGFAYLDSAGTERAVPAEIYTLDMVSNPQRVVRNADESWPTDVSDRVNAVTITFQAGYTSSTLPHDLKQAVLMLAAHWFENRSAVNVGNIANQLPLGFHALLQPHRQLWVCG